MQSAWIALHEARMFSLSQCTGDGGQAALDGPGNTHGDEIPACLGQTLRQGSHGILLFELVLCRD